MSRRRIAIPHDDLLAACSPGGAACVRDPADGEAASAVAQVHVGQPAGKVLDYWTRARMRAAEPVPTELGRSAPADRRRRPRVRARPAMCRLLRRDRTPTRGFSRARRRPVPSRRRVRRRKSRTPLHRRSGLTARCSSPSSSGSHAGRLRLLRNGRQQPQQEPGGDRGPLRLTTRRTAAGGPETSSSFPPTGAALPPTQRSTRSAPGRPSRWRRRSSGSKTGNFRYDIGVAVVGRNDNGQRLQAVVGARGIGFSQPRDQNYDRLRLPAAGAVQRDARIHLPKRL